MAVEEGREAAEGRWPAWAEDPLDAIPTNPTEVLRLQFRAMQYQTMVLTRLREELKYLRREQAAIAEDQLKGLREILKALKGIKSTTDILGILLILSIIAAILSCLFGGGILGLLGP